MPKKYDLLVIGGGSGGLAHAQRAAEYGASVAIIEQALIGGTCVNVGCVPKKVMWYAANYANQIKYASDYGFEVPSKDHNWLEFKIQRDAYIGRLNNIYETNLSNRGIEYIVGEAKFIDANNVKVNDDSEVVKKNRLELLNFFCKTYENFIDFKLIKDINE